MAAGLPLIFVIVFKICLPFNCFRDTKVSYLDHNFCPCWFQKYVRRLYVSVQDPQPMDVMQSEHHLAEQVHNFLKFTTPFCWHCTVCCTEQGSGSFGVDLFIMIVQDGKAGHWQKLLLRVCLVFDLYGAAKLFQMWISNIRNFSLESKVFPVPVFCRYL